MPISLPIISNADDFDTAGRETAMVPTLAKRLPYDRGDMSAVLTQLAFRLAHALEENHKDTADRLLALAVELNEKGTADHFRRP